MFYLFYLACVFSKMLVKVEPHKIITIDFPLPTDSSDLTISLFNVYPEQEVRYKVLKDTDFSGNLDEIEEHDSFIVLEKDVIKKYSDHGNYKLLLLNTGSESTLVSLVSYVNKTMGNEDNDVKALKKLLTDIETRLTNLYNVNLRLKGAQDKHISEAHRKIKGLYVLCIIPVVYILVGLAKVRAVKMMFAPKKGIKP